MIAEEDVLPALVKVVSFEYPEFQERWEKHRGEWDGDDPVRYLDVAEIAHHLVDAAVAGRTQGFPAVFELVEKLIAEGDASARELVIIGLLEDIQTILTHTAVSPEVFLSCFGLLSRQGWDEVARAWEGKHTLTDVLRAEMRAKREGEG